MSIIRPEGVPAHAEAFSILEHFNHRAAPSVVAPGATQIVPELICPRCKSANGEPHYGVMVVCHSCGLHARWAAGYLFAWDVTKADAA